MEHKYPDGYGDCDDDDDNGAGPKCAKVCMWQKKRVGDISETDLGRHVRRTGSGQYCF